MATYQELFDLANNEPLLDRVEIAIVIAAQAVVTEAGTTNNHANRLVWAASALTDPKAQRTRFLRAALAQNAALTSAQISAATDAALLSAIQSVIDLFAV